MLSIKKNAIKEENDLLNYKLNYPIIINKEHNNIIDNINQDIYQDIQCFKEIIQSEEENITHAIAEYRITLNKNNIISIPIEFSQLIGLYDISYINAYNYDLNLEKEIKLSDLFKSDKKYKEEIKKSIEAKIKSFSEEYEEIYGKKYLTNIINFITISDEQIFYIEEDKIVICFSSYEMGILFPLLLEFEIYFKDCENYLSKYTLENIYNKEDYNEATSTI